MDNFEQEAKRLIDKGICFTLREFDFPQKDVEHTAFFPSQKADTSPMVVLIGRSLPHCQTEEEIIEAMDDMLHAGGVLEGPKVLEEIAAKHWYDSPEFALRFIKAESTYVHNPRLHARMKEAVLNLIPEQEVSPRPPYENMDLKYLYIVSAIHRILMHLPSSTESGARQEFVDSLIQSRPRYAGFFNDFARLWLNRR